MNDLAASDILATADKIDGSKIDGKISEVAAGVWGVGTRALTDKSDFVLTSAYDKAKSAAAPGDILASVENKIDGSLIDASIAGRASQASIDPISNRLISTQQNYPPEADDQPLPSGTTISSSDTVDHEGSFGAWGALFTTTAGKTTDIYNILVVAADIADTYEIELGIGDPGSEVGIGRVQVKVPTGGSTIAVPIQCPKVANQQR